MVLEKIKAKVRVREEETYWEIEVYDEVCQDKPVEVIRTNSLDITLPKGGR